QQSRLALLKTGLRQLIPFYVDHAQGPTNYVNWFSTQIGSTTNGCGIYPTNFPMYTVTGLLARVGAPTNYFDYTPWRPLDENSQGVENSNTLPGFTTADYGWKYIKPLLTNLRWSAYVSGCMSGRYTRTDGYAINGQGNPVATYGAGSCSYDTSPSNGWSPCSSWGTLYPRAGDQVVTGSFSGSYVIETYKHTSLFDKDSSGYKGAFSWQESIDRESSEDHRIFATGTVFYCRMLPTNGVADLYLIKKGQPFTFSVTAYSSGGFATNCWDSDTNTSVYACWETGTDMARAELIETFTYSASSNYCFAKTNVALNPPSLNGATELSRAATAQSSASCVVGGISCSYTETKTMTEKYRYYRAQVQPGFLFKWVFKYN
ncbi:MAG: hypothetical protein V2A34_10120, partial [Lentisphaerota bacterium]